MIKRIRNLSQMSKEHYLKELPCPTFKQARAIARDPNRVVYYFRRSNPKMPPLLFEQRGLINAPEPKEEDEPTPAEEPAGELVQLALI